MEEVVSQMEANNKEMSETVTIDAVGKDSIAKEEKIKENVISEPKVNSSLTGDEKSRYQAIGKEMFAPILSSLEKLIQREKKKNDMTITNGGDEGQMKQDVIVQYDNKENPEEETSWIDYLMDILVVIGAGAVLIAPKIIEFFSGAWEWIKDLFSSIASFFDFENGPIAGILELCTGALKGLWSLVTKVFKALASVGTWIWEGIKKMFNTFITGPNGILSFGIKLVKGIVDFAKNAVNWLGDVIMDAILWPIKAIFGGAEDDGKRAGEEAAESTTVVANEAVHQQQVAAKSVTDKAIMSQQQAEESWKQCIATSRAEAKKRADEVGLKTNVDGTVSDDAIKQRLAENMLETFEKENDAKLRDSERAKLMQAIKAEIKIKDGKLEKDGESMRKAIINAANAIASSQATDSGALDIMQDLSAAQLNTMSAGFNAQAQQYMDIKAQANVKNDFDSKTEEEKFLFRMEEAKKRGALAEFRISEARNMIVKSIETIKETFGNYDKQLTDNFATAFDTFVKTFIDKLDIKISPANFYDNSKNDISYNIMPLSKDDFKLTSDRLVSIAEENTMIIKNQNAVLADIKNILELSQGNDNENAQNGIENVSMEENVNNSSQYISSLAPTVRNNLLSSSTSWIS